MAVLATEKVLTLDYWKPAAKLQVGDYVFDCNGRIVKIKTIQQYFSTDCYEVTLNDHLRISGDDKLGFMMETPKYRIRACEYKVVQPFRRPLQHFTVDQLLDLPYRDKRGRHLRSIPTTKPLNLPHQDLPIPPFIFGFWLFNERTSLKMCAPAKLGEQIHQQFKDFGYQVTLSDLQPSGEREFSTKPSIRAQLAPNVPSHIPNNYLLASAEQRTELLRGILHSKSRQYQKSRDMFRFTSGHYGTIQQVQCLVESLGHRSSVIYDESKKYYTLFFRSRTHLMEGQKSPRLKVHQARRYVTQIERIQDQMCVHIETTAPDNTILVGEGFIACR